MIQRIRGGLFLWAARRVARAELATDKKEDFTSMARHNVMLFHHDGTRIGWVSRHRARHLLQSGAAFKINDDPLEIRFARELKSKYSNPANAREALKPDPSGDVRDWVIESHAHSGSLYLQDIIKEWGKQTALKKLTRKKPSGGDAFRGRAVCVPPPPPRLGRRS